MRLESRKEGAAPKLSGRRVFGRCLCGAVELEIDFPAFWAWHYYFCGKPSRARRRVCDLYRLFWRKHARVAQGQRSIARFEDAKTGSTRSFCSRCGTPLLDERQRSLHTVNIPRALFTGRTGREPRYHVAIEELQDWGLHGQTPCPPQGLSRYCLGTPEIAEAHPRHRSAARDFAVGCYVLNGTLELYPSQRFEC